MDASVRSCMDGCGSAKIISPSMRDIGHVVAGAHEGHRDPGGLGRGQERHQEMSGKRSPRQLYEDH